MNNRLIIPSLIACAITIGCGKQTADNFGKKEATAPPKANHTQEQDTHSITNFNESRTSAVQTDHAAQLPENFPSDVHVHPNARILIAVVTPESTMIGFEVEDSVETVAEQYKKAMLKNGWAEKSALNMNEAFMVTFSKEKRIATITITADDAKTQISLVLAVEPH